MALLLLLPNEIIWSIMRYLKPHAGINLLQSCRTLHELTKDEKFWREYARYHCITYCDPARLWYTLYATGDLFRMCSHIDYAQLVASLPRKRQVFWEVLADYRNRLSCCKKNRSRMDGESALCMGFDCEFVGCGGATFLTGDPNPGHIKEHCETCSHPIILKLSPFNFLEMWCYACRMPLGFWGFSSMAKSKDEQYIIRLVVSYLTQLPNQDKELYDRVLEHRRWTERRLLSSQEIVDDVNIVEKPWFMKWLDFIIDASNDLPGMVPNEVLFDQEGVLRADIKYGEDFVLVSGPVRSYLERTYGVRGKIVAGCELAGKERYQNIYKSIFARRDFFLTGPPLPIMNH